MDLGYSHAQSQRVLKQRNAAVGATLCLTALSAVLGIAAASRDREVILQPVLRSPLTLSSSGVSRDYLEAVTRDAAVLTLNRTPQSLDYWMKSVLDITDPRAFGAVKADLLKIAEDQRGSSIAQYFTMESIKVDPVTLTSDVTGTLHTMVGREEVSAAPKLFHYGWSYNGVSLKLLQFGLVVKDPQKTATGAGSI